ncbi:MAG: excinuclease ABC subunit UvrC [Alphaproteobacteria bacterium]|nr:excinuclease ABC subunit UvrC [Alphaproteobacteria bacterium]
MSDIKRGLEVLKSNVKTAPEKPGVYRMISASGEVLYVGKAKNIKKRIVWYTKFDKLPTRLKQMVALVDKMEFIITENEAAALLSENELIKRYHPRFNILLKDDKSFPYLSLDMREEYPILKKYRGKKTAGVKYFGPFANVTALDNVTDFIQKVFRLRTCRNTVFKNRSHPCLLYQIKRCSGPCTEMISKEDYQKSVQQVITFLEGKNTSLQEDLSQKMMEASDKLDFETALVLREQIKALSAVSGNKKTAYDTLFSTDVIGFYQQQGLAVIEVFFYRHGQNYGNVPFFFKETQDTPGSEILDAFISDFYVTHDVPKEIYVPFLWDNTPFLEQALQTQIKSFQKGEKAKLLADATVNAQAALERYFSQHTGIMQNLSEMAEVFHLKKIPERIEIYDNSHNQGSYAVGAMVVATRDGFDKKSYRTFNIKNTASPNDDFGMMKEVLRRRFDHLSEENKPDVILIDGGEGQLSAVHEALKSYDLSDIAVIAISKGPERNAGKELYHQLNKAPFALEYRSALAFYMQTLRDEAHRFAIGTHRKKRAKSIYRSALDDIEGIGAKRKKDLLLFFGSVEEIKSATLKNLQKVDGISKKTAEKIYKYFHK